MDVEPPTAHSNETTTPCSMRVPGSQDLQSPDQAFQFLMRTGHNNTAESKLDLTALRRKVDRRVVIVMFLCYTAQFVDKYAAVMGIGADLKLKGNDFSNAATAFFIAYLVAEVPIAYTLNKMPVAKLLACSVILWGIATACTAAANSYHSLLVARICLGIFEAATGPCLTLLSSQWYTKAEQAPRFSFWYCGLGFGQIVGGAISFGFQHDPQYSLPGWRAMFIALGCITAMIGAAIAILVPDTPMSARFLTNAEKAAILRHVAGNLTGIRNEHFKIRQAMEILIDPQIWLLVLITILISISSGVITTYSTTLIKDIGVDAHDAVLLNMPSGLVSIGSTVLVGFAIRFWSRGYRSALIAGCCVPGIVGGALMSFIPANKHSANKAGLLAGIYLVNSVVATLVIMYQWTAANVAGYTKRVVSMALIAGSFGVGNIIGPQTFQAKDAPQYIPAKIILLVTQAAGAVLAIVLLFYYRYANTRKERQEIKYLQRVGVNMSDEKSQWDNLTDMENVRFRYVY